MGELLDFLNQGGFQVPIDKPEPVPTRGLLDELSGVIDDPK